MPWALAATVAVGLVIGSTAATIWMAAPESDLGQSRVAFLSALKASETSVTESSRQFGFCHTGGGRDCVVDGDTLWMDGVKIRIADIDAPETHPSRCAYEDELGRRATNRLRELLNEGSFQLEQLPDRDEDRYGRKLRIVIRNGYSLGDQLVSEGLARTWTGRREPWC